MERCDQTRCPFVCVSFIPHCLYTYKPKSILLSVCFNLYYNIAVVYFLILGNQVSHKSVKTLSHLNSHWTLSFCNLHYLNVSLLTCTHVFTDFFFLQIVTSILLLVGVFRSCFQVRAIIVF